tara:strand:- start:771 stop:3029 length:2259 start_codon:yes stop_codon:yes gene_type:complete
VENGTVTLYHNGASKLATTSTGIDVTGSVTADDMFITGPTPNLRLTDNDVANEYTNIQNASGGTYIDSRNGDLNGPIIFRGQGGGVTDEYARFIANGNFGIGDTSPSEALSVTGNIAATGTVTADGLTVETAQGDISIANSASSLNFARAGINYVRATDASGSFRFITGADDFTTDRITIASDGDISFYEDTGTTAKFFWDASTERLGIGTVAPSAPLTVSGDTTQIRLENTATGGRNWGLRTFGSALGIYDHTAGAFRQYIDSTGKVGIGNTAPATALDVTGTVTATSFSGGGGTMTGNLKFNNNNSVYYEHNSNGGFIPFPGNAQYITSSNAHTGAIKIKLPVHGSADMISFHVDVYDYSTNESFSLFIAGYVYQTTGGNEWVNVTVRNSTTNTAKDFTVRFGADGTNQCVWIGETNSTWAYPQITVRDLQVGYTADVDAWADDWAISFVTTFDTVDETISNNLPYAKVLNNSITGTQIANNAVDEAVLKVSNAPTNGYALTAQSGNTGGLTWAAMASGGSLQYYDTIETSGTYTPTQNGTATFFAFGGGGAGGVLRSSYTNPYGRAAGGGAGGAAYKEMTVTTSDSYTITIGAGGATSGNISQNTTQTGNSGSSTTVTGTGISITGTGGSGGTVLSQGTGNNVALSGPAGGSGSGGDGTITGASGEDIAASTYTGRISSAGGTGYSSSIRWQFAYLRGVGGAGFQNIGSSASGYGNDGTGFFSGGSGAGGNSQASSGAGSAGVVFVVYS